MQKIQNSIKNLVTKQNTTIRFASEGDLYIPSALVLQINSVGADIKVEKSANKNITLTLKFLIFFKITT